MRQRLTYRELERFNRIVVTALELKAPLDSVLETASSGGMPLRLKNAILSVSRDLTAGKSLSEAMGTLPTAFSPAYRQIIAVADRTGNLLEGARAAEQYLRRMIVLDGNIWKSLILPVAALTAGYALVLAIIAILLPDIEALLLGGYGILPAHVQTILSFLREYAVIILFCGLPGIAFAWKLSLSLLRTSSDTPRLDAFRMRLPLFGSMFLEVSRERFDASLLALVNAGAPFISALKTGASVSGNAALERAVSWALARTSDGSTLSESLRQTGFFSSSFCWLMSAAEERGDMARTFAALQEGPTSASRTPRLPSVSEHVMTAIVATAFFGVVGLVVFLSANLFHGG